MKKFIYIIFTLSSLLFILSCSSSKKEDLTLKIIQTTDIHGTIFPYDFIKNEPLTNSLANVYSFVKEQRSIFGDNLILLDNGDYLQGQPTVYYYNFEDTSTTHLAAEVFNFMKYDATTVGNHDIETGHPVYDKFRRELNAPYLAANAINNLSGEPYFEPYTIIEKQGIKIAVLGLITPGIPDWLPENLWEGIHFEDMIESAEKWISIINEKENPDLIIGMFHAGVDHMYDSKDGAEYMNQNASKLVAQKVPGFDIILAGHDHKMYNEKVVNIEGDTVILLDPRSHSRAVSDITVNFTYNKKEAKYQKSIDAKIKEIEAIEADSEFMETFKNQYNAVKNFVSEEIGEFTRSMDSKDAYFGNSSFIDLIHQIQLDETHADVSFTSPLSFRGKIEKGPIYISDLFKLYKFENMLYTLSLTGKEIDGFLEYSSSLWFNQMKNKSDHLLKLIVTEDGRTSLKGQYYNCSSAAGINYLINVSKPAGNQVKILGFDNGKRFYLDSSYTVAVNSYRGNGGGGHLTEGAGLTTEELKNRLIRSSDHDIRYLIMNWIKEKETIHPEKGSNWRIIPEDYYEFGKNKDSKALFEE
ncbi:MAG: bifunctional metallophosphatase/5'-nucleotidase [Salinivirgaceae bacterium]|nr:bifunctional metallophosphatase/5'-nucleotidase [Salinivirgaceae bacterium]